MTKWRPNRIGLLYWRRSDGISELIAECLATLGYQPEPFIYGHSVPDNADIVLSHGPHGELLPLWTNLSRGRSRRPIVVHWNTEGPPDLRLPRSVLLPAAAVRSAIGQLKYGEQWSTGLSHLAPVAWVDRRLHRFRYVGDYVGAHKSDLLDVLADSSVIYNQFYRDMGFATVYVPWGTTPSIYGDLGLQRDIDVLWMGKRGTARRSRLLDRVRRKLKEHGVEVYMADNEEHPFVFGQTRTEFLNRAKVTLNITRTWYDDNFSRFAFAAPNRSLVVSEPLLPHCVEFVAGVHYVSAAVDDMAETIVHYLRDDSARQRIVDDAYSMAVKDLAFHLGLDRLMKAAAAVRDPETLV
jgi:hypothetical protein